MSGIQSRLDSNYIDVTVGNEATISAFTRSSVQLLPIVPNKQDEICAKLNAANILVIDSIEYQFTAEVMASTANMNVQSPITGKIVPTQVPIRLVKISFNIAETSLMLPFIYEQLDKLGYGLDLYEKNKILRELNVGTEHFYLHRANEKIKELAGKGDELGSKEYHELIYLLHEVEVVKSAALAYKIAQMLRARNLFACALGVIALYRTNNLFDFNSLAQQLHMKIGLSQDELRTILKKQHVPGIANIERVEWANDGDAVLRLQVITTPHASATDASTTLIAAFKEIKVYDAAGELCKIGAKMGTSTNEPKCEMLRVGTPSENIHALLDRMFMTLHKHNCLVGNKTRYEMRKGLGVANAYDYLQCASTVIAMLREKELQDDPASFEYHWLIQMSYELPVSMRAAFVNQVAQKLLGSKLHKCAQAFVSLYANDPLCADTMAVLRMVPVAAVPVAAVAVEEEEEEAKAKPATMRFAPLVVIAENAADAWVMTKTDADGSISTPTRRASRSASRRQAPT